MKKPGLLIAGILLFQICFSQGSNHTDWNSDLDFLAKELPARHYLFTVRSKNEFLAGIDHIKKQTDRLNDLAIAIRIQQLIAGFGDSHTNLNFSQLIDKNKILPLHLYWFSDGREDSQTTQDNIEILGHRILTVNGVPLERITDSLSTLFTIDNHAIVKYSVPKMIPAVQVLEYFGFAKNQEIELGLKDLSGETKNYIIKPAELNKQNRERYKPDSLALCYQDEKAFFTDYFLKADRIYYIQYNRCWSKELELKLGNAQNAENMLSKRLRRKYSGR